MNYYYYFYTPLIALLINLFLIYLVLRQNYRNFANQLFSLFLISMAAWAFAIYRMRASSTLEGALSWDKLTMAAFPWIAVLFFHFTHLFTSRRPRKRLLLGIYITGAIFTLLAPTNLIFTDMRQGTYGYAPVFGITGYALSVFGYFLVIYSLFKLVEFHRTAVSSSERNRATLMIAGVASALFGTVTDVLHAGTIPIPPLGIVTNILFGLLATIAILKYNLLNIRVVVGRGLAYTLLSGLAVGIYVVLIFFVSLALRTRDVSLLVTVMTVLLIAIILQPLLGWVQKTVDKWFYQERYYQLIALEQFSREKHDVTDFQRLSSSLVNLVKQALVARRVYLLMPRSQQEDYVVAASTDGETRPRIQANSIVLHWLTTRADTLYRQDLEIIPQLLAISTKEREMLAHYDIDILIALKAASGLAGILLLGPKVSGKLYSDDDQQLLAVVSRQVATTLDNARLYEQSQRAYRELRETQEQLIQSEKLKALGEMTTGIAHDFNNMLTTILGRAQLAQGQIPEGKARHNLQLIEQAALDAAAMVRRLQDFARLRTDRSFAVVELNKVITSALEMVKPRLDEQKQTLGSRIELMLSLEETRAVSGSETELREALVNILINAIEAMPEGGKLRIQSIQEDNYAIVAISDTGIGMSKETQKNLFVPFFTTKGPKGSGMGLSIVYGIIKRHNGEILVSSQEFKGTTITIRLPITQSATTELKTAAPSQPRASNARILVVDDDDGPRAILCEILIGDGHQVDAARTGTEGLDLAQQGHYDLVLADLGLPDISGIDLADKIRTTHLNAQVALVTGWGVQLDLDSLKEKGVSGIVTKPYTKEDITAMIVRLLTRQVPPTEVR